MKRFAGCLGISAPPVATALVLLAGILTPRYDPLNRTISRLAEPGLPASPAVELAILLVGAALIGLAAALGPGAHFGRVLLGAAGCFLLIAAVIPLDPASTRATNGHRLATMLAMLALTGAPLAVAPALRQRSEWRAYGPVSFAVGVAEVGMLLLGLALLSTSFAAGAWERCLLALPMAWMVLVSVRLLKISSTDPSRPSAADKKRWAAVVSAAETIKAAAASVSSGRL